MPEDAKTLSQALNEVTEESIDETTDGTTATETAEEVSGESTESIAAASDAEGSEEPDKTPDAAVEEEEEGEEEEEEADIFDNITPEQLAEIKANPTLNSFRKALMKGYEAKTTEFKQLVQLGEAWKQNPARVVNALAESLGLTVTQAKAVAAAAGATADAAAAAPQVDPLEEAAKELEALFGEQLGPRVRGVFDKWADARLRKVLGTEITPMKQTLGQVVDTNEKARMLSEETLFKSRHKDLTPDIERRIVELGNSGKYIPGRTQTPQEYLEALYDIASAQMARETAKKATGNAAKQLARKIDKNRQDREPSGVSGRGGTVKPVSKISNAKSISEALDLAEAELQAEGV